MLILENSHLYSLHEMQHAALAPVRAMVHAGKYMMSTPGNPLAFTDYGRSVSATFDLIERITRRYGKPEFGLSHTEIEGKKTKVTEKTILSKPFCNLLRFQRAPKRNDPKLLIVAPLSGHHATLLRGTVEALLPHLDVYITDWIDGREVPYYEGNFDLDDYIDYVIEFLETLGPDTHVMGVCQPSVPVLAAVSIMSAEKNPNAPRSMTFMGGPIDTRENPTEVNSLAETRHISWFEQNVITRVPFMHPGFMRRVYPGFLQLTGFMQMNLERHMEAHAKLFQHLIEGDDDSVDAHKKFYNEYLSVMDLPAEFYLQTIRTVFQEHALPKGEMVSRDRPVDPSKISKTALLTVEGERDDISGVGQTKAAHKLCKSLPADKKKHYLQKGVGHYGIFNGKRYREQIAPLIVDFIHSHNGGRKKG